MHLRRTHGIINIRLRSHFGLRLLLLYSGEANNTFYSVIQDHWWQQDNIMLYKSSAGPTGMNVTLAVVVDALDITVTGGVVIDTVTWDTVKNTLHRKMATILRMAYGRMNSICC